MSKAAPLAAAFLSSLEAGTRTRLAAAPDLESQLERLVEDAGSAFPFTLAPEKFLAFVAKRMVIRDALSDVRGEELYPACACAARMAPAAQVLVTRYGPILETTLARVCRDAAAADDAKQITFERLLVGTVGEPQIAEYTGRGSLSSWLQVVAIRVAFEKGRAHARRREEELDELIDWSEVGEEAGLPEAIDRQQIKEAFGAAMGALAPRLRTVLRLNVLEGLNIEAIGGLYSVHRSTVARWISDAHRQLLRGTRANLFERLGLRSSELDSLLRLVDSQLELSLARLLRSGASPAE